METETQSIPATPFRLLILGDGSVRTVPLTGSRWIIGRSLECTIALRDPTVSRRHVKLERHGDGFVFEDLGGSNPIAIDGRAVSRGILEPGQTMAIGLTRLVLERRNRPAQIVGEARATVVHSREVIDEDAQNGTAAQPALVAARRVLERIEWTFADLGSLRDAAEPLLELGLNLTERRRGVIGRFTPQGGLETLAAIDAIGQDRDVFLPAQVLAEVQQLGRPVLLTASENGQTASRLALPLGHGPEGVMLLEEPAENAPLGQDLLRLGATLAAVVWHRLQEVTERLQLRAEVQRLRFRGTTMHNALLASTRLHETLRRLRELGGADHGVVLLLGEEGTERASLARYLHVESCRAKEAFVGVNLANLPAARYETEIFGDGVRSGALFRAAGGTLFLDGTQLLPLPLQARLAAAAQSEPAAAAHLPRPRLVLGSDVAPAQSPASFDATLAALIGSNEVPIPPLRSEPRDALPLAELFLSELGSAPGGAPRLIGERAKRILTDYSWPGNVHQLRQVIEAAAGRAGNQPITPRHLPPELTDTDSQAPSPIPTLEDVEQRHIREVLQRVGGNRSRAAQALGIAHSTLYWKLKRYAIDPDA